MDAAPTWDLDGIVSGGPGGTEFHERVRGVKERLLAMRERVEALGPIAGHTEEWAALIAELDPLRDATWEVCAFAVCASAADIRSADARTAAGLSDELRQIDRSIGVVVSSALDDADEQAFETLLRHPKVEASVPRLRHARAGASLRLDRDLQTLKVEMDRESLTGWGRLYDLLQGDLTAEATIDGKTEQFSVGQLAALRAHPSAEVRKEAFRAKNEAWGGVKSICAHTLTQITGARQQFQDRVGVDELASSRHRNRIEAATLDALWAAADALRPALVRYLKHKATVLGQPALDWWERDAPLPSASGSAMSWSEATRSIRDAFGAFHPELQAFADKAFDRRWIDAEPRTGRRPGGFCISVPESRESRIFMSFAGTMDNALTLAHELGHAYHNEVLANSPESRRDITSALAETASTFAEAATRDYVLATATDPQFRAFMLDQQLQAAVAFLMDIPSRFGFERRLFALRRDGVLSADALCAEMVEQQRTAFGDAMGSWDELFWCSKLHFYIPSFGFYNWPYTFGYLFSAAVYERAKAEGPGFLDTLKDLLIRTGWQSSEELAMATLGVDLTDPAFWIEAARPIEAQVAAFIDATS